MRYYHHRRHQLCLAVVFIPAQVCLEPKVGTESCYTKQGTNIGIP
jgi:hypothetical protein